MNSELDFDKHTLKYMATGGLSVVYEATPKLESEPVLTLKLLRQSLLDKQALVSRFQKEQLLLEQFNHPSLPALKHYGVLEGRPYLTYSFIKGQTILSMLQHLARPKSTILGKMENAMHRLTWPSTIQLTWFQTNQDVVLDGQSAIAIIIQLFDTLDYLHTLPAPIIHGDISPENLIINQQQKLFIIDFGCALEINSETPTASKWIGKPSYLSPEQARGLHWDHRSDLYQAGIIFYELLTRRKMNTGSNERLARIVAANPPRPDLTNVPESLTIFFVKILAADPNQRFQSASECLVELRRVCRNHDPNNINQTIINL